MARIWQEAKLLTRHSAIYASGTLAQQLAAFVLLPLYTSFLTPADYGAMELINLTTDILGVLMSTMISSAVYRFYFQYEQQAARNAVVTTGALALAGICLVVIPPVMWAAPLIANWVLDDPAFATCIRLALASLGLGLINRVSYDYLRVNQRSVGFVAYSLSGLLLAIALNILFIVVFRMGILGIFLSTFITTCAIFLSLTVRLWLHLRPVFDRRCFREMLAFGLPMMPAGLCQFVTNTSGRFLLKMLGSLTDTGLYSLALRIGTAPALLISQPFNQTWLPRRFEIAGQPDSEHTFSRIFTYFLVLITWVGLGVSLLAPDIIRVIADPAYHRASGIVPWLIVATTIFTFRYHLEVGLLLTKNTKYIAIATAANALAVVGLSVVLIPPLGALGAALALLVGHIVMNTLVYVFSRRVYPVQLELARLAKVLLSAAMIYGALFSLKTGSALVNAGVRGMGALAGYPVLLLVLRTFTRDELARARNVLGAVRTRLGR